MQRQFSWIDGDRQCALGASYGGFMINWINGPPPCQRVGNSTLSLRTGHDNRFSCLVNHDGLFSATVRALDVTAGC